jgi:hypothetical protein
MAAKPAAREPALRQQAQAALPATSGIIYLAVG